ncbi:MAG TPA: tripartite tricarboxylate transporter substrate binding protein [Casimicrobiaceae bacterium]|nr:tripartite tricarboxylate transporter substrate binding protein [Casimicrobiaceae bacterium]
MSPRRRLRRALVLCAVLAGASPALALDESYPARPIKIIVGQGPGTTSDILARLVGAKLSEILAQPVVIEGRPGAAGTIAAATVANAPADGYTLLLASSSNLALATAQLQALPYDPVSDFAPIRRMARIPWALGVRATLPVKTVRELIAYAKANPGKLTGGSTGPGSAAALGLDMLSHNAGIDILNVSYKTSGASIQGVLAGEVDILFTDLALIASHVQAGSVRLLAAAGPRRLRAFPDLPSLSELGIGEIVVEPWYGLVAPAATPAQVMTKLRDGLARALRSAEVHDRILELGYDPIDEDASAFSAAIRADIARYSAVVKQAKPAPER